MLKAVFYLSYTELLLRLRCSHEWLYPLVFFVIITSLFPFAFTPDPAFLQKFIPGGIWLAALFASLLSLESIFFTDLEDGNLEQLLLSGIPLPLLLLVKMTVHWLVTELPLLLLIPFLGLWFHFSADIILALFVSLLLGTPIFTLLGSLAVALTLGLRQQGALLGLLILPLLVPVLICGVTLIQQAQQHFPITGAMTLLAAILLFAITLLPWAIAATLRISLED